MNAEDIDKLYKEKLYHLDNVPPGMNWNKDKGWRTFRIKKMRQREKVDYLPYYTAVGVAVFVTLLAIFVNIPTRKAVLKSFTYEATNQNKEIVLPQGNQCTLRQGGKLTYISGEPGKADTIEFKGEAYFNLSDKGKVIIKVHKTLVTCFQAVINVRAIESEPTITITSLDGNVYVSQSNNKDLAMFILPDDKCMVQLSNQLLFKEPNDDINFLAWKTGVLKFDNTPLNIVAKTLADYYRVTISFENNNIQYCRFSSTFKQTDIKQVIGDICQSLQINFKTKNNHILLAGGECR